MASGKLVWLYFLKKVVWEECFDRLEGRDEGSGCRAEGLGEGEPFIIVLRLFILYLSTSNSPKRFSL